MKYLVIIQEERTSYGTTAGEPATKEMETTDELRSDNPQVVAAFLRGVADKISPPEKAYR